jgi:hypothetical protein
MDMGFLERTGETYKVPMLYRDGLNIKQGKAFQVEELPLNLEGSAKSEGQGSAQKEGSTPNS